MAHRLVKRLALTAAGCLLWGVFVETRRFTVRRVNVPVLPTGAKPLRVLHLSDLHVTARSRTRLAFIETLAGLEPDLVIDTGDNVAQAAAIEPLGRALGRLLDVPGAYVFGSGDYEAPVLGNPLRYLFRPTAREVQAGAIPTTELDATLSRGGWVNVAGRRTVLELLGTRIELRGTDDAHIGGDDYGLVAGPASAGVDVSLGVTHSPYQRVLDAMAADGVDLILAGHTHGGQVCLPGMGALTTNCDLPCTRAKGLSEYRAVHWGEVIGEAGDIAHGAVVSEAKRDGEAKRESRRKAKRRRSWLHVSAGLGQSPYAPFRFACPPEVTVLTLTPR